MQSDMKYREVLEIGKTQYMAQPGNLPLELAIKDRSRLLETKIVQREDQVVIPTKKVWTTYETAEGPKEKLNWKVVIQTPIEDKTIMDEDGNVLFSLRNEGLEALDTNIEVCDYRIVPTNISNDVLYSQKISITIYLIYGWLYSLLIWLVEKLTCGLYTVPTETTYSMIIIPGLVTRCLQEMSTMEGFDSNFTRASRSFMNMFKWVHPNNNDLIANSRFITEILLRHRIVTYKNRLKSVCNAINLPLN